MMADYSNPERGIFCTGWNFPLSLNAPAALYIHSDRLVIRALWREYSFPSARLVGLKVVRVLFWRVIRFQHSLPEYARFVAFRPFSFSEAQK